MAIFGNLTRCYCLWLIAHLLYTTGLAQQNDVLCQPSRNCTECLLQGPNCMWCAKPGYKASRCDTEGEHLLRGCENTSLINPSSEKAYTQNYAVRNADKLVDAIQIKPQIAKVRLYPGRSVKIPITFRIAEDYPVDLYYIMDLSYSMEDDQQNLVKLGELLAKELRDISKDVQLGFGAFVDKNVMPFSNMRNVSQDNPCFPKICEPQYGFINRLPLTNNFSDFNASVTETPISGNQDGPEGGLDALIQAMVCDSDIGWRKGSRKIILYSTDDRSHIAADAKVAGIVEPNDGHCHLKGGEYTHTLLQDYPSISHIASVAKSTSTSIIFAITEYTGEYEAISKLIPSSVVGRLANDSSNIVTLIRDQYRSLIKTVSMGTSGLASGESGIKVDIRTTCNSPDGEFLDSHICDSVGIDQKVTFQAELSLTSCNKNAIYNFAIKPHDLSDSLSLRVETLCECDCSDDHKLYFDSLTQCSGAGNYKCGVCECKPGFDGEDCQCDRSVQKSSDSCQNPVSKMMCSGRGDCSSCSTCQCDCLPGEQEPDCARYSGEFCECNSKGCDQRNGQLCSGQGNCTCEDYSSISYCKCEPGFLGSDCGCPISNQACRADNFTGKVCNGKGTCHCGKCQCTDSCYEGTTCSIQKPECSRACVGFRECVACHVKPNEIASCSFSPKPCESYKVQYVPELSVEAKPCSHTDMDGCKHYYLYQYDHASKSWIISILNQPQCQKDYWLEVIIGLCAGILLLGVLALIIWKVVVTVHDKREFSKFEKEALQAKWESTNNPIYKPATSTFRNPMYNASPAPEPPPVDL